MADCPNRQSNAKSCTCPNEGCERRGICCACVRAHREANSLPMCLRGIGQAESK